MVNWIMCAVDVPKCKNVCLSVWKEIVNESLYEDGATRGEYREREREGGDGKKR